MKFLVKFGALNIKTADKFSLYISPIFIVMVVFFGIFIDIITIMSYIIVMCYHEFAHSCVAQKIGYRLNKYKLMPYGASVSGDYVCVPPKQDFIIAMVGPLSNFVVAILCVAFWWLVPSTYYFTECIVSASIFVGLINLLPVFPLDGGRMLLAVMNVKFTHLVAYKITKIIGIIVCVCIIICGIIMMFFGGNLTYITLAIFMLVSVLVVENEIKYERLYSMAFLSYRINKGLCVREIIVSEECTLYDMSKMLSKNYYTKFIIMDYGMNIVANLTETEFEQKLLQYKLNVKVKEVDFFI